jgi:hypothetical protein
MYECSICHGLNHAMRLHCQTCGTVPAQYSILSIPSLRHQYSGYEVENPVVAAYGAERQESHRTSHVQLRTVEADYYAEGE